MIKNILITFILLIFSSSSFSSEIHAMKIANNRLELSATLYGKELSIQDPTHKVHCKFLRKDKGINNSNIPYDFIEYLCPKNVIISVVSYGTKRNNEFTVFIAPPDNISAKIEIVTMWLTEYI